MNLKDLIELQINSNGYFRRADIVVKYMALENILGKNENGLEFYERMYSKLCVTSKRKRLGRINNLKSLLDKIDKGTFDSKKHPVLLTPRNNIWDGTHRIACACYFNMPSLEVRIIKKEFRRGNDFGMNRLKRGFSKEELDIIIEEQKKIFDKIGVDKKGEQ